MAHSAELVMFYSPACEWCQVWDEEVGVIYERTAEGKRLPLRRVSVHQSLPPDLWDMEPIIYTPTFVLMASGREAGRITGYPGEAHFWGLLGALMGTLQDDDKAAFACGDDMGAEAGRTVAAKEQMEC